MVAGNDFSCSGPTRWKSIPGYAIWGGGLLFLLLHFAIWPLVWHEVLLPKTQPGIAGFRVETYHYDLNFLAQDNVHISPGPLLALDKPLSLFSAYTVWQVSQGGIYRLQLSGAGRDGTVFIDNRPTIDLRDLSGRLSGETQKWLSPGPHLMELRLRNRCQPGWLLLEAGGPGRMDQQSRDSYEPQWSYPDGNRALRPNELTILELGNIDTWLSLVHWGEYLCLLGVFLSGYLGLRRIYVRHWAGKIFPNRRWKIVFLALALVTFGISWVFHLQHPLPPIWSDGLGYYSYLPSCLIYHDLSQESLFEPTRRYGYPAHGLDLHPGEGFVRHPATGRYLIKYPLGTAVMEFPFFLLAHLAAPLLGATADGFSWPYQVAIDAAASTYLVLGLIFLLHLLRIRIDP